MQKTVKLNIAFFVSVLIITAPALAEEHAQKRGAPAEAQAMVARAIALYDKAGMKAAFDRFTNRPGKEFKYLDLYIFVLDAADDARIVAHAQTRSLIGMKTTTLIDPNGLNIGRATMENATPRGAWADYGWKDPLTGKVAPKSSWVVLHKGYIFGCGVHKP